MINKKIVAGKKKKKLNVIRQRQISRKKNTYKIKIIKLNKINKKNTKPIIYKNMSVNSNPKDHGKTTKKKKKRRRKKERRKRKRDKCDT